MKLYFTIDCLGWIACAIKRANRPTLKIIHSSDYGDQFQALLNSIFILYSVYQEGDYVSSQHDHNDQVVWCQDFIEYTWKFSYRAKSQKLTLSIIETYVENPSSKKLLLEEEVTIDKLLDDIYESLDEMLSKFGLIGYKRAWEVGNFPIAEFLELKARRKKTKLKLARIDEKYEEEFQRISLEEEMKLLAV